jgi:hypothetical protein
MFCHFLHNSFRGWDACDAFFTRYYPGNSIARRQKLAKLLHQELEIRFRVIDKTDSDAGELSERPRWELRSYPWPCRRIEDEYSFGHSCFRRLGRMQCSVVLSHIIWELVFVRQKSTTLKDRHRLAAAFA